MSLADAAILTVLGVAGFLVMQQRQASASNPTPQASTVTLAAATSFANSAVNAALMGAGLAGLIPPQPTPAVNDWSSTAHEAVTGTIAGTGLMGMNFNFNTGGEEVKTKAGYKSPAELKALFQRLKNTHGFNVNINMAVAMCIIESGSVSFPQNGCNPNARRFESHLGEASAGLMQVLPSTAKWLAGEMGYRAKGTPNETSLYNPETGAYFGLAYLDYLSKYKGVARNESFIVQGYNAGPTHNSASYWSKYQTARAWVNAHLGA